MSTVVQFLNGDIICFPYSVTVDEIRAHIANERGIGKADQDLIHLTPKEYSTYEYFAVILSRHSVSVTKDECEQFIKCLSKDEDDYEDHEDEEYKNMVSLHTIINQDMLHFLLSHFDKLNDTFSAQLLKNPSQLVIDWILARQLNHNLRPLDRLAILQNPNDILVDRILSTISDLLEQKPTHHQKDLICRLAANTNPKTVHFVVEWLRQRKNLLQDEFDSEFVWLRIWKYLSNSPVQEAVDFVWECREDIPIPREFWMNGSMTSIYMLELLRSGDEETHRSFDYIDLMSYVMGTQNEEVLREFVIPRVDTDWNISTNTQDDHTDHTFYTEFLTNPHDLVVDWILHQDRAHDIVTTETAIDLNPNSKIVDYILDNRLSSFVIFENPHPRVQTYAVEWAETYSSFDQTFEDMIDRCASWKVALIAKKRFPEARYNLMKWLTKLALDSNVDISFLSV